jgi:outer membrane protein OmpA-like peptidoglycan-associated protein
LPVAARVSFERQPDAGLTFISQSSESGYLATIARPGTYLLRASLPGYLPEFHELNLDHDSLKLKETLQHDFFLIPITINQILPFRNILFDPSSSAIAPIAKPELQLLYDILRENPGISIRLEGHTDNVAQSKSSMSLARRRIKAVKKFLESKGIDGSRIELKAFGGGNPLFKNGTLESHQANRRVEVRVIAL